MLYRLAADLEDRPTVGVSVLGQAGCAGDAEELAAMDAVVHWFGD